MNITTFNVYALPSLALGETASNPTVCGSSAQPCILYIGQDQTNPSLPHVWSQAFSVVKTDASESGTVNPGDGTIPSAASVPSSTLSTVTASPATAVANGLDSSTVTVTLLGSNSAPVTQGTAVTLTPTGGSSVVTALSGTTDANGVATFKVTDTAVETATYQASAAGVTIVREALGELPAPAVSPTASSVVASPTNPALGGTSTVTVTLRDQGVTAGTLAGKAVTLTQDTGAHSTITPVSPTTDTSGVATFSVTDATAELVTYTASAGGVTVSSTGQATFGNGPATPSPTRSSVSIQPSTVVADGVTPSMILVTIRVQRQQSAAGEDR